MSLRLSIGTEPRAADRASVRDNGAMNGLHGIRYGSDIARAARNHGVDPLLLAAVAAQETGGPGADSGANIVGDGGHGHGLFQIDDRYQAFATTPAANDPGANADYAASLLSGLLQRYGGNVREALSAYNAGSPEATGTLTSWSGGSPPLGYADSVLRHEARLATRDAALVDASQTTPETGGLQQLAAGAAGTALGARAVGPSIGPGAPPQVPSSVPPLQQFRTFSSEVAGAGPAGADADRQMAALIDPSDTPAAPSGLGSGEG
jgi:hypothetical protein